MRKATASLLAVTAVGAILGAWMTADGLHVRLYAEFLRPFGLDLPHFVSAAAGLSPQQAAWPILAIGLTWFGALGGLWLGHRWGFQTAGVLALVSLLYLGPGTVLGLAALACLWAGKLGRPPASPEG